MPAFLRWVDFSSADREQMRRAIALFQEQETRDELGLGTIRDAFANALFPGTSTIMTRLRYFLFVPWIYRDLERRRVGADKVAGRARELEVQLIRTLKDSEDTRGVIGKRSVFNLQRLPSSIYWAGLQRWKVCCYAGSQSQYHQSFDWVRARRRALEVPEDEGVERESLDTWHPRLPEAPEGWLEEATFALTREEASFLQGRMARECDGTALAWLAVHGRATSTDAIWLHPLLAQMPAALQQRIDLARRFSLVAHGAALLYNLQLAELVERSDLAADYREALGAWAGCDEAPDLRSFDLEELWAFVEGQLAPVPTPTRRFVHGWVALLREHDPASFADLEPARELVRQRERAIKGSRSRFSNARARDQWNGASGTGRLEYRWGIAQDLLDDLYDGQSTDEVEA